MKHLICLGLALALAPAGAEVSVGQLAPTVRLRDQQGNLRDVAADYGRHYVALAFYPKDDTSGCTLENKGVTAALADLTQAGIVVYGISVQDVASKQAFCSKYHLQHTLLADVDQGVCKAYGTLNEHGVSSRWTFILDPARIVRVVDKQVKAASAAQDILAAVKQLETADTASSLAKLADAPATVQGVKLRLPDGWTASTAADGDAVWQHPTIPGLKLELRVTEAAPDLTADGVQAQLPDGVQARVVERVSLGGINAMRADWVDQAKEPKRYKSVVTWASAGKSVRLSLAGPADRADDIARLLAQVAGSVEAAT